MTQFTVDAVFAQAPEKITSTPPSGMSRRAILLGRRYIEDVSGATAIEYGLLAAVVGLATIVGAKSLGYVISEKLRCTTRVIDGLALGSFCINR